MNGPCTLPAEALPGIVTLFFAEEKTEAIAQVTSDEPTHGWSAAPAASPCTMPAGNHHTMMRKPHVMKIGARCATRRRSTDASGRTLT